MEITKSPAHTCVDRPNLPCDACEVPTPNNRIQMVSEILDDYFKKSSQATDRHLRGMIAIAFRFGFRACLSYCVTGGGSHISDDKIDELGKQLMGAEYYQ